MHSASNARAPVFLIVMLVIVDLICKSPFPGNHVLQLFNVLEHNMKSKNGGNWKPFLLRNFIGFLMGGNLRYINIVNLR